MERIYRNRKLTAEEAAKYDLIRKQVAEELPELIAKHKERTMPKKIDVAAVRKATENTEARSWLQNNPNEFCFAGNRFDTIAQALELVNNLYNHGATHVAISGVHDEEYRILEEGGPYADTLLVTLPIDPGLKKDVLAVIKNSEPDEMSIKEGVARVWWD